jgi:hypothetical protein
VTAVVSAAVAAQVSPLIFIAALVRCRTDFAALF